MQSLQGSIPMASIRPSIDWNSSDSNWNLSQMALRRSAMPPLRHAKSCPGPYGQRDARSIDSPSFLSQPLFLRKFAPMRLHVSAWARIRAMHGVGPGPSCALISSRRWIGPSCARMAQRPRYAWSNRPVDRYRSPLSGRRTTIFFPAFSGSSASRAAA